MPCAKRRNGKTAVICENRDDFGNDTKALNDGISRMENSICNVRYMTMDDLPQVASIERKIFTRPWTEEGFGAALAMKENIYLVAVPEESGEIIGYCGMYVSPGEGEIVNVAVDPCFRRRGAAQALLDYLIRESTRRGVTRWILEVRVSNKGAIALYERMGFESLGIRRGFYESPREDALIMAREKRAETGPVT